jgi:hypothetical protein
VRGLTASTALARKARFTKQERMSVLTQSMHCFVNAPKRKTMGYFV